MFQNLTTGQFFVSLTLQTASGTVFDKKAGTQVKTRALWLPTFNPGRDRPESWGAPDQELVPHLWQGFRPDKGVLIVAPLSAALLHTMRADWQKQREALLEYYAAVENAGAYKIPLPPLPDDEKKREAALAAEPLEFAQQRKFNAENPAKAVECATVTISGADVVSVLEALPEPEFIVLSGQRRASCALHVEALRRKLGVPDLMQWGALVREAPTHKAGKKNAIDVEALSRMLVEDNASAGKLDYDAVAKATMAVEFLAKDPTLGETALGRLLGLDDQTNPVTGKKIVDYRGTRQKLFRFARVCRRFPELNLLERIAMPETVSVVGDKRVVHYVPGGYVPLNKLGKEELACCLGDREKATKALPETTAATYKEGTALTAEQVEEYIALAIAGSKPPRVAVNETELKAIAEDTLLCNKTATVGEVVKALLTWHTTGKATLTAKE